MLQEFIFTLKFEGKHRAGEGEERNGPSVVLHTCTLGEI